VVLNAFRAAVTARSMSFSEADVTVQSSSVVGLVALRTFDWLSNEAEYYTCSISFSERSILGMNPWRLLEIRAPGVNGYGRAGIRGHMAAL